MNIRSKFLVFFIATAVIPLVVLAWFMYGSARESITKGAEQTIQNFAALKEGRSNIIVSSLEEHASTAADNPELRQLVADFELTHSQASQQKLNDFLRTISDRLDEIKVVSVTNTHNEIIASSDSSLVGTRDQASSTGVDFKVNDNELPIATVKKPIVVSGATIGTVDFVAQGDQLASLTNDYTGLGDTGDNIFMQVNGDDSIAISSSRLGKDGATFQQIRSQLSTPQITNALRNHTNTSGVVTVSGEPFLFTLRYIPSLNAAFVVKVSTGEALSAVDQLRDNLLVFAFIFILLLTMAVLLFVHSITSPISNLATIANAAIGGNLSKRALVLSKDEIGNLATAFNFMLDNLQELKDDLEKKVQKRTQQLEASNKELESFSYSVSHDLRAPLRAIDGFSRILEEDYSKKLDDEGKQTLKTIIESTKQMGRLIDDLLTFSRLGRQEVKKQEVDVEVLVRGIYAEILQLNPGRTIELRIKKLPMVHADAALLRQVWTNLISNAVKFTRNTPKATIEIGARSDNDEITFYIKDNGAGFDMAYADKLFGVFQRLHDQRDFEGTGVGLAIVKRVVERHGGTVEAKAAVGKGATFSFALPGQHKRIRRHKDDKKL